MRSIVNIVSIVILFACASCARTHSNQLIADYDGPLSIAYDLIGAAESAALASRVPLSAVLHDLLEEGRVPRRNQRQFVGFYEYKSTILAGLAGVFTQRYFDSKNNNRFDVHVQPILLTTDDSGISDSSGELFGFVAQQYRANSYSKSLALYRWYVIIIAVGDNESALVWVGEVPDVVGKPAYLIGPYSGYSIDVRSEVASLLRDRMEIAAFNVRWMGKTKIGEHMELEGGG